LVVLVQNLVEGVVDLTLEPGRLGLLVGDAAGDDFLESATNEVFVTLETAEVLTMQSVGEVSSTDI
jgi:hypothetical protein